MIESITSWARTIIIAIIVGTVIELILPENKNKKYIKVIVGVFVLFSIMNPVLGKKFNLNEYDIEKYTDINQTNNDEKSNSNITKVYQDKIIKSIKEIINNEGYDSKNIIVTTDNKYNVLSITISNIFEYKEDKSTSINKVEVTIKDKKSKGIAESDKSKIVKTLSDSYGIDEKKININ